MRDRAYKIHCFLHHPCLISARSPKIIDRTFKFHSFLQYHNYLVVIIHSLPDKLVPCIVSPIEYSAVSRSVMPCKRCGHCKGHPNTLHRFCTFADILVTMPQNQYYITTCIWTTHYHIIQNITSILFIVHQYSGLETGNSQSMQAI